MIWNKFWIYLTHDYEFQHFEPIQYVNNVPWFSFSLQQNDHEINIKFDQFSNHSQSMTQQSCTSFSQKKKTFLLEWNIWLRSNEFFKDNYNLPLDSVISLLDISYNKYNIKKMF